MVVQGVVVVLVGVDGGFVRDGAGVSVGATRMFLAVVGAVPLLFDVDGGVVGDGDFRHTGKFVSRRSRSKGPPPALTFTLSQTPLRNRKPSDVVLRCVSSPR